MKTILLSLLSILLISNTAFSQDDSIYYKVRTETCSCLSGLDVTHTKRTDLVDCIRKAISNSADLITQRLGWGNDSSFYKAGVAYGQMLGMRLDTALIYSCDNYFKIVEYNRFHELESLNRDSLRTQLTKITSGSFKHDEAYYNQLSFIHLFLGNYAEANNNAQQVLKTVPTNLLSLLVKAYYLESIQQYSEASLVYRQLMNLSGQRSYLVWAVAAQRKQRELK